MYTKPITERDFPSFAKVFESLARSKAPSYIWYLPDKDNYCSMPVPKIEQEEVLQQDSFAHSITKDSLSGELRRLESFAQPRCCINFHRNKLPENGLLRRLAVRWLEEIILRSSVSGSLELLDQLTVLPKESPAVSESVTFAKHVVFVQKTLDTVLDDRVQPEEAKIGSLYIYTHEKKEFAKMIKIGQTGNTVESRLEKWSKCGHGDPTPLCTFEWICHPQRVELLTHFELVDYRRETWCMVHSRSHMEWFDIDVETAGSIIMHWSSWMKLKPYNDQGRLRPFWKVAIKFLTKHRTLKGETMLQMQEVKEDVGFLIIHRKGSQDMAKGEIRQLADSCPSLEDLFCKCMGFYKACDNGTGQHASKKEEAKTRLRSISCFCERDCKRRRNEAPTIIH